MRHRLITLTHAVLGVAIAATIVSAQTGSVRLSVELPDNPVTGARLFVTKQCVRCHAPGSNQKVIGPELGRIWFPGTILDLAGALWNHSAMMREKMQELKIEQPVLTTQETTDLMAFVTAYRYYLTPVVRPANALDGIDGTRRSPTGRAILASKRCDTCHNGDGRRPDLALERYRGRFSAIFLAQAMWNHGGELAAAMQAPVPEFAGREMNDLLAYFQEENAGSGSEQVYFEPGSPQRGRELFARKRCGACHAVAGTGGRSGPDLGAPERPLVRSVASIAGVMWNHSVGMRAEFQQFGNPRVPITGQEMADIIAYLYFVNYANVRAVPARGSQVFDQKCGTCHTLGGGRRVGPDLSTVQGLDEPIAIVTAMWNHGAQMQRELPKRELAWPRFEMGQMADLIGYLLSRSPTTVTTDKTPGDGGSRDLP